PLARSCTICGILVHRNHHPQHEALHSATTETGLRLLDRQSPSGGYFCDLCGVAFRSRENLYSHWRSSCVEIMANIEPGSELFLSDLELKAMVLDLLWRLRRVARQTPLRAIRTSSFISQSTVVNFVFNSYTFRKRMCGRNGAINKSWNSELYFSFVSSNAISKICICLPPTILSEVEYMAHASSIDQHRDLCLLELYILWIICGRLERHIAGFHSYYGPFRCVLCGHRFKYEYNLLFHYRHSCAYTKLLVGADVRKVLDAASLRKLVSHIKQSDPQLRPGCSRLINIKRRPSLRAVPRNIRSVNTNVAKVKQKHRLNEGTKCPVCAPKLACSASEAENEYSRSVFSNHPSKLPTEHDSAEEEAPPVLEVEGPSEVPVPPPRCVDVNGEEIHDFDAEQLSELDLMLHTGQLSLGDLEDVEYRIAAGTRHGSQIILEKSKSPCTFEDQVPDTNSLNQETHQLQDELRNNDGVLEYVEVGGSPQYLDQEDAEVQYESDQLMQYEIHDSVGHDRRRIVRLSDDGQHLLEYLDDENFQCDGFVEYVDDENGHQVIEFIENGSDVVQYLIAENVSDSEVIALLKSQ
ncbi:hypothetical protein Angca_001871, partial [Angiostrongylus cantonensis]